MADDRGTGGNALVGRSAGRIAGARERRPLNGVRRARAAMLVLSITSAIVPAACLRPCLAEPFDTTADAVLGQGSFTVNDPNAPSGTANAANMAPSSAAGMAIGPDGRVYVADAENNRVLSWPDAEAVLSGAAADLVVGQPDFVSGDPNRGSTMARADGFYYPQGVDVDESGNLWVTDAFNNRVLKFNNPVTDDGVADLVIGQADFTSDLGNFGVFEDYASADSILFPGRVLVRGGDVYVADSGNSRVLHYSNPTQNKPFADVVFGQLDDFTRLVKNIAEGAACVNGADTPCGPPTADNLYNPIGLALDADGNLYIADWNNHRVLRFDDPLNTDTTADAVYGQADFAGGSANAGGPDEGLHLPIDLAIDPLGRLLVADSGNNRVVVFRRPLEWPSLPGFVFGQFSELNSNGENHGLGPFMTDAGGLFGPTGVDTDSAANVYVLDTGNNRALRFDRPMRGEAPTDFNGDHVADLADVAVWMNCFSGADVAAGECQYADVDGDGAVDLVDGIGVMNCLSGPAVPADRQCP